MDSEAQSPRQPPSPHRRYLLAAAACSVVALVALPLRPFLDPANTVMLFLLAVFLVAVRLGRGPAVMAAFLCVALFDFFFVPPQLTFAVADAQYLVTFAVMLAVGLVAAHLAARLAERTEQALLGEQETRDLYEAARQMAGALSAEQVAQAARTYLGNRGCDASLLFATAAGDLSGPSHGDHTFGSLEHSFALSAFRRNEVVEADSLAGTGIAIAFFPLRAPTGVRGILAVAPRNDDAEALRERRASLEAVASLVALAVERLHYAEVARAAELQVTEERLRGSVLSSLSHDLRTPLTTLVGLADSLAQARDRLPAEVAETAGIIRDQAGAMHRLLSNLLEMARLQVPNAVLRREWQPFEEVVGSSLRLAEAWLGTRQVTVDLPAGLPLLEFDAVLIERVLCNLLENAVKYSPEGSRIELAGRVDADWLTVSVGNEGPGFPPGRLDEMFDLFVRGHGEPSIAGVGLGLAICKAIVAAHGGSIRAENRPGGACVRFTLPLGTPPAMVEEAP